MCDDRDAMLSWVAEDVTAGKINLRAGLLDRQKNRDNYSRVHQRRGLESS